MKMNRFFCLGLVLIFCSNSAFGMAADKVLRLMYRARAKQFLQSLSVKKPSCELSRDQLTAYLNNRVMNAEKIMRGDESLLRKELLVLDPQLALSVTRDDLDTNPNARACYFYPKMTQEHLRITILDRLRCNVSELAKFEESADAPMPLAELQEKVDALSQGEFIKMLLQSSHSFATAILVVNFRAKY